ncbi:Sorting nexin mvp-1 [Metarhizium album ARSEF 1941]|uniref:Sorting nexin MVP1 n=1 Tax=Metarhizium album (strain ARSEF 1941) TaxID=1081103 RepID=A0A0B2WY81_METAS|nr:Sorting nexin mvp-1 [Metarhizium album ARSEF 1941]KHO01227.1 Sorting nexin mvp-1 [Metarhizium album ARSEF 1941]
MSLFGSSPPEEHNEPSTPTRQSPGSRRRGGGLFDESPSHKVASNSLFDDGQSAGDDSSPWDMPTPRGQKTRADMVRNLLPASDVPDSYIAAFDVVVRDHGFSGRATAAGIANLFANARLGPEAQTRIMSLVAPGDGSDVSLGRNEFNVLLALVGLAQEGDIISLDGVDERRRNLPQPKLPGLTAEPVLPPVAELAAKPPQTPNESLGQGEVRPALNQEGEASRQRRALVQVQADTPPQPKGLRPAMDDPEDDPWNTPEVHKGHDHSKLNGSSSHAIVNGQSSFDPSSPATTIADQSLSQYASAEPISSSVHGNRSGNDAVQGQGGWGFYGGSNASRSGGGFADNSHSITPSASNTSHSFGGDGGGIDRSPGREPPANASRATAGRTGSSVEENIVVTLMPGKEGVFLFQHHNYEVASQRRGSKVIRRYSDFVWLLDCLHKRYPFRVLPLLPPKRVAVNGNHLSNDGAFIEKRRRGLARFLNALVRHPVLGQEQLVVMFLTVPTELAVWRKQATISVQDEFADRALPPGLEDSLPPTLEELFSRTKSGVRRSAELYINVCNIMDRLVKRTEGVAADHARVAMSLTSLTETSADTYATDTNEIPLLNDGLVAMSKHLRTCQTLLEDESRGWDEGVLEDLKRQRDSLVSVRELFDRRDRLDKDNIPYLERRIQANETKLAALRAKPEGTVKPGEIEKVAEAIIKDKESIVQQHKRSVFVKECIRDELVTFQSTQYHVSRWNQDWAGERVKYAEMLADNWRRLLDELEGMPLGD